MDVHVAIVDILDVELHLILSRLWFHRFDNRTFQKFEQMKNSLGGLRLTHAQTEP